MITDYTFPSLAAARDAETDERLRLERALFASERIRSELMLRCTMLMDENARLLKLVTQLEDEVRDARLYHRA